MKSEFNREDLQKLYIPPVDSHKGQNGKLMVIGGSHLFHAASLWSLTAASRIVDMVFYSSIPENNEIVQNAKEEFRNGIVVRRDQLDAYIEESDVILIGPGMPRAEGQEAGDDDTKELTERLLKQYPRKKWVIDGGSLQVIDPRVIPANAILTPHQGEFDMLFSGVILEAKPIESHSEEILPTSRQGGSRSLPLQDDMVSEMAKEYNCIILLKGPTDIVCSPTECISIPGGNAGMTKGGTGDVLAGLVAGLACKNDPFLATTAGSYINKKAGESLEKTMGLNFNASDLASEIPMVMQKLLMTEGDPESHSASSEPERSRTASSG